MILAADSTISPEIRAPLQVLIQTGKLPLVTVPAPYLLTVSAAARQLGVGRDKIYEILEQASQVGIANQFEVPIRDSSRMVSHLALAQYAAGQIDLGFCRSAEVGLQLGE